MPIFNFSIPVKKESKRKVNTNVSRTYNIIEKDVLGVVFITLEASFYVYTNRGEFKFTDDSFSCKNIKNVYAQLLDTNKQRILCVRAERKIECDKDVFLPFAAGVCVIGNIVEDRFKTLRFNFKKAFVDADNKIAQKALNFWRTNYEVISENKRLRRIKENE